MSCTKVCKMYKIENDNVCDSESLTDITLIGIVDTRATLDSIDHADEINDGLHSDALESDENEVANNFDTGKCSNNTKKYFFTDILKQQHKDSWNCLFFCWCQSHFEELELAFDTIVSKYTDNSNAFVDFCKLCFIYNQ